MRNIMYNDPTYRMRNSSKILGRLIAINIVMFILLNIILSSLIMSGSGDSSIYDVIALNSDLKTSLLKPWTYITSMFAHFDFFHILSNMLYLWWFGTILKEAYGGQSVLASYVLGGLAGAFLYVLSFTFFISPNESALALGASGGVTAIMVASAVTFPNRYIDLFLIGRVKLKWIVLFLFILSSVVGFHINTGGKIDHIGGALFGLFYALELKKGNNIAKWFDKLMYFFANILKIKTSNSLNKGIKTNSFRGIMDRRPKGVRKDIEIAVINKQAAKREMDMLLDKVKKHGYKNITTAEKKRLEELSKYY